MATIKQILTPNEIKHILLIIHQPNFVYSQPSQINPARRIHSTYNHSTYKKFIPSSLKKKSYIRIKLFIQELIFYDKSIYPSIKKLTETKKEIKLYHVYVYYTIHIPYVIHLKKLQFE